MLLIVNTSCCYNEYNIRYPHRPLNLDCIYASHLFESSFFSMTVYVLIICILLLKICSILYKWYLYYKNILLKFIIFQVTDGKMNLLWRNEKNVMNNLYDPNIPMMKATYKIFLNFFTGRKRPLNPSPPPFNSALRIIMGNNRCLSFYTKAQRLDY